MYLFEFLFLIKLRSCDNSVFVLSIWCMDSGWVTLIRLVPPLPITLLLDMSGVCQKADWRHSCVKKKAWHCRCVWKYTIIKYTVIFFYVCILWCDVNKPNTHKQHGGMSEGAAYFPFCCHSPCSPRKWQFSVNHVTVYSESSSTCRHWTSVLGTPKYGSHKSGMVRFAILVSFATSDNGKGHNCITHCTVLNRTARWKQAIKCLSHIFTSIYIQFFFWHSKLAG